MADNDRLRERRDLLAEIARLEAGATQTDLFELRERHELLTSIEMETEPNWSDLDELRERADLLDTIDKLEDSAEWTDIEELRERVKLLTEAKE